MFSNCVTTTDRGSVGEAHAILEFVKRGWIVSKPINDKAKYDLVVDDGKSLLRVQVKTSIRKTSSGGYAVKVESGYANRNQSVRTPRADGDYDALFVLIETGESWFIPVANLGGVTSGIVVGSATCNWQQFKVG